VRPGAPNIDTVCALEQVDAHRRMAAGAATGKPSYSRAGYVAGYSLRALTGGPAFPAFCPSRKRPWKRTRTARP
jgi:hypothetical protein